MKIKLFLLGFGLALSALSCYASDIPDFYFYDCESKFSNLTGYCQELPLNNDTLMGKQFVSETVVYMQKSQRIPVKVTLLFTAKGLNDKDKHVDAALKSIAYGDKKDWKYDKALDKKAAEKYFASFYKLAKSNDARTKDGTLLRILSD